jgi:hypothetical protein
MENTNNLTQLERKDMDENKQGRLSKLHLDTTYSKGTACNRKGYGCK